MIKRKRKPTINTVDEQKTKNKSEFLALAVKRFQNCLDNSMEQRKEAADDIRFVAGIQWTDGDLKQRELDRRPCLTVNRILTINNQVINDMAQNTPSIKYRPVDSVTDIATADIISGLARHILNRGDSKDAIDWAVNNAINQGWGFFRVLTDYCASNSFEQDAKLMRINNPASVYLPFHLCQNADFSDMMYAFIREKYPKEEFEEEFGKNGTNAWKNQGEGDRNWYEHDSVYVAEYFIREKTKKKIYLLDNGQTVEDLPEGIIAEQTREKDEYKVYRYLITENEIFEDRKELPGQYIPIVAVLGQEFNVDGVKKYFSITRNAKDSQRMHNFWLSAFTEMTALQPKAPFVVPKGMLEGFETQWREANNKTFAFLEYNGIVNGQPVSAPQRVQPPIQSEAIITGVQMSSESLKETTGIYDASLGSNGQEKSGKAIIARQRQGDVANFHFVNNLNRALRYLGRILINMIPEIYDSARAIHILGEDLTDEVVVINQVYQDPNDPDKQLLYDLTAGEYDVVIDTGPSYETRRMEAADSLTQIIQAVPQIGQVCSDILVRNLDFPGASELSERLKKTIPPQLIDDKSKNGAPVSESELRTIIADLQAVQQQSGMKDQQIQQMTAMIQQMQGLLKEKTTGQQLDMEKTVIKAQTEIQKAQLQQAHENHGRIIDTGLELHKMAQQQMTNALNTANPGQAPAPLAENNAPGNSQRG